MSTEPATIWDGQRRGITLGSVALIFFAAIEALAVTTVMPVVSADLDGQHLYAAAFTGTLATGVIGMVATGAWSDRAGPRRPLYVAVALFIAGLVIAGSAPDMQVFLVGRLVQGLGAGGQTVALYVVVARLYPPQLHGRVFAAFAAAWVVPSMIGPFLSGAITELLHWRWAFLGVAALAALAFVLVAMRLRHADLGEGSGHAGDPAAPGPAMGRRLVLAAIVAACAVAVSLSADIEIPWGWAAAAAGIVGIALAIRPLLPRGVLRALPRLPSVVLLRGMLAGAFFAAETYIPYLLMERFGFSPMGAGLALTTAALAWSGASAVQGRWGDALGSRRIAIIGLLLLLAALGALVVVAVLGAAPWAVLVLWGLGGGGMGLLYPRLTVLTLAYSTRQDEGFHSSALSISDSTGSAVAIALAGLVFAAFSPSAGFVAVFAFAGLLAALSLVPALRIGDPAPRT